MDMEHVQTGDMQRGRRSGSSVNDWAWREEDESSEEVLAEGQGVHKEMERSS